MPRLKLKLPIYLTTVQVAQLLNRPGDRWDAQRARRWLKREGALEWRGGRLVVTREALRRSFPEIWDEIVSAL